jgi:hypothetical protein
MYKMDNPKRVAVFATAVSLEALAVMLSPISRNPGVMQMLAFLTPIAFVG